MLNSISAPETGNPELWNQIWSQSDHENSNSEFWEWVSRESSSVRSVKIRSYIQKHLGSLNGIKTVEVGSGLGVYSFIFARLGADVTLIDYSPLALEAAKKCFKAHNLKATFVLQDALNLNPALYGQYDVAMSFGTVEHFKYPERLQIMKAHTDLIHTGGIVVMSAPNSFFFPHEFLKSYLQRRNKWQLGYEDAFTHHEFSKVARTLNLKHTQIVGSAFLSDFQRYLRIYRSTSLFQKFLGKTSSTESIRQDRPSLFDDVFGADLVLLGMKNE